MASNSRIQGISIVLEGETTGLQKALQDVNKRSIELQSELRDVDKLLKFNPDSVEALSQKTRILQQQFENTTEKLNRLRKAQEQVERQFKSGDIGEKQYRAFRREIEYTEQSLKSLDTKISQLNINQVKEAKTQFDKLEESISQSGEQAKNLGDNILGLAAGIGAVKGAGEVLEKSLDVSSLNTKIDIAFNVPEESVKSVKEAAAQVQTYGVDSEEALEGVRRQWALNADATDEANQQTVKFASTVAAAYSGVDFTEIIQESSELSKILGINTDEAVALMDTLIEMGFPPEQVDIIAEYGQQLQAMGYNAEEVMGLFASGVSTGTQNIDQLIDGVKEGRILMAEFGATIDEETGTLLANVGISTEQFQAWGKAIAAGGDGGKKAMEEVATAITSIEDKTLQNQLGVKVYGTLWEEQQTKITSAILGVNDHMLDMGGMIDVISEKTQQMDQDPTVRMRKAMSDLTIALTPLLEVIAQVVGAIANWVSNNPKLAAALTVIATVLGMVVGLFAALSPIVTALTSLLPVLGVSIGAIAAPIGIVVAAIAGLITIGVLLWQNWDTLKVKITSIWQSIKDFLFQTLNNIKQFFSETVPQIIQNISDWFNTLPERLGYALGLAIGTIIKWGVETLTYIKTNVPIWIDNIINFFSSLPGRIWTYLLDTISKTISFGQNLGARAREAGSNFINNILSSVKNLPSIMAGIGMNIVQGVWNGISSMWGWFTDKVTSFFDGIVSGVKSVLGIHSPSRVFAEIGTFTGEGFINGLDGMKKAVSKAGQEMANASIPNIKTPDFSQSFNNESVIYLTTENYLDSRLIGTETTKLVTNNMSRSSRNYRVGKGGLKYA